MKNNTIDISVDYLNHINEQLILLTLDTKHLMMALQAVQVDCAVSKGVINAVIMALSGNTTICEDLSDQLGGILSAPQKVTSHD